MSLNVVNYIIVSPILPLKLKSYIIQLNICIAVFKKKYILLLL